MKLLIVQSVKHLKKHIHYKHWFSEMWYRRAREEADYKAEGYRSVAGMATYKQLVIGTRFIVNTKRHILVFFLTGFIVVFIHFVGHKLLF